MIAKSTIEKFQDQINKILTDKKHQIELVGYIAVFLIYLFTHLINLVEYPSFHGDEMFYVLKAVIWKKTGTPSMPDWDGNYRPEFTNPSTLSWIYMVLFDIFGTTPLIQRLVMLIIGIINLLFVFLVGREIGGTEKPRFGYLIGILAGLLLALDQEFICYSRTGYLDNPMNLCLTISLYFFLQYLRTENQNYTWVAGFAAGIAFWFKLSACYFLIGLALFALITRKIDAFLRIQAVITLFLGLFVLWGFSIDPVVFVKGITFQLNRAPSGFTLANEPFPPLLWMLYWLHFALYDYGGPNFDLFRILIFFSIFIPIYYIRKRNSLFNEKSFLVVCLLLGAIIFFSMTKSLYVFYAAGFMSFFGILFGCSTLIAITLGKNLQNTLIQYPSSSPDYQRWLKRGLRGGLLLIFFLALILKFILAIYIPTTVIENFNPSLNVEFRSTPSFFSLSTENLDVLEILSYVQQEIPVRETFVASTEIGPWLNASGYNVYVIGYINQSPPDFVVREYIQMNVPHYIVLHKDYQYIIQDLEYTIFYVTATYKIWRGKET